MISNFCSNFYAFLQSFDSAIASLFLNENHDKFECFGTIECYFLMEHLIQKICFTSLQNEAWNWSINAVNIGQQNSFFLCVWLEVVILFKNVSLKKFLYLKLSFFSCFFEQNCTVWKFFKWILHFPAGFKFFLSPYFSLRFTTNLRQIIWAALIQCLTFGWQQVNTHVKEQFSYSATTELSVKSHKTIKQEEPIVTFKAFALLINSLDLCLKELKDSFRILKFCLFGELGSQKLLITTLKSCPSWDSSICMATEFK